VVHRELVEQVVLQVLHLFGKVTGIVELHTRSMMLFITMEVLIFHYNLTTLIINQMFHLLNGI
jgi:hypothetical protein